MNARKSVSKAAHLSSLLLSAMLMVGINASAKPLDDTKEWADAGITWSAFANKMISSNICNMNAHAFVSCVRALQSIGETSNDSIRALIPTSLQSEFQVKTVISTFGGLELVDIEKWPFDQDDQANGISQSKAYQQKELAALQALFPAQTTDAKVDFEAALASLRKQIDPKEEPVTAAMAYDAFLGALFDPHTHLMIDPALEGESQDDNFVGIGIEAALNPAKEVTVLSDVPGSPALKAGVHANDIIVAVDGKSYSKDGKGYTDELSHIRGTAGTTVTLTVNRGGRIMNFKIVRAAVTEPNFSFKMLTDERAKIGYLKLSSFMDDSKCDPMAKAIGTLQAQGARALILDLRGNPGGIIGLSACIGGLFVGKKLVATLKPLSPGPDHPVFGTHDQITHLPMAVLVNAGSASASELLSGALQDYQRAWIIGERTFGKGSEQSTEPSDLGANVLLAMTEGRFFQPSGRTNQDVGIQPNFVVHSKPNPTPNDLVFSREEDLYTNALPPLSAPWVETRPAAVAKISACMQTNGLADKLYASHANGPFADDYQLFKAEDVLVCAGL